MPLPRSFYARDTVTVARDLVGRVLVRETEQGPLAGIIVEAEAYGPNDPSNHAFKGLRPRCATMFGPSGHAYVYRSYGVHWCLNAVTCAEGVGEAVLIRALEPISGMEVMASNRGITDLRSLCRGPGNLTSALGIAGELDAIDLTGPELYIAGEPDPAIPIAAGPRIGVTLAADRPWRFYIPGSRFVSRSSGARPEAVATQTDRPLYTDATQA